jgi:RimJ/RimL family protein N-acetyltransferase
MLRTERLKLRAFTQADADDFFRLNSDHEVMVDLGGPLSRTESDQKLIRYINALPEHGTTRMALVTADGTFLGYTGIMRRHIPTLGWHHEIGWRLKRSAWGKGYVSEAATCVLKDGFTRLGLDEILSYTGPDNVRSQKVMSRLNLTRRPELDFSMDLETMPGDWTGMVWSAARDDRSKLR